MDTRDVKGVRGMAKKPPRTTYWVSPDDGDWRVRREGAERAAAVFEDKADALARAKELAKEAPLGQVIVQGENGRIKYENTYHKDPRRTKG